MQERRQPFLSKDRNPFQIVDGFGINRAMHSLGVRCNGYLTTDCRTQDPILEYNGQDLSMTWRPFLPQVLVLTVAGILSAVVACYAWQRRQIQGGRLLSMGMLAVTIWTLASAVENAAVLQSAKILWSQIQYIGLVATPPLMLLFLLDYTQQRKRFSAVFLGLLFSVPALILILAWTNSWHHLIWTSFSPVVAETNTMVYGHGNGYWIFVAYAYVLYLSMALILMREFFWSAPAYRAQIAIMAVASLFPALGGGIYAMGISPVPGLDWTPIGGALFGVVIAWGIFRQRLLDLMPIAREALVEQLQDGVIVVDTQNRIIDINRAARDLFKTGPQKWIGAEIDSYLPINTLVSSGDPQGLSLELELSADPPLWIELHVSNLYIRPTRLGGRLILLRNISRRKQAELKLQQINLNLQSQLVQITDLKDQLKEQAIHDSLTGLYNRRFLEETLHNLIPLAQQDQFQVSFLMLDIDHFKRVNDAFGHPFGDEILRGLGELFIQLTRREDIVCRYGGEEFMIVFAHVPAEVVLKRAEEIRHQCESLRFQSPSGEIGITLSIGMAIYPVHGETAEDVIKASDQALYMAKTRGRNQVAVCENIPVLY